MRKLTITVALAMALSVLTTAAALAHGPTCSDFGALDVEVHGQHITRDYVKGEAHDARGTEGDRGALVPGGPGPGYHFPNNFAPGASFCTDSQSPGIHVELDGD